MSCAECVRPFPRNKPSRVRRGMSPASRLAAILDIAGTKLLCLLSSSELSLQPASNQAVFLISCKQVGGCTCPQVRSACPWFLLLGTHSWIRRHFTCFKQSQYFVGICLKKKTTTHTHKIGANSRGLRRALPFLGFLLQSTRSSRAGGPRQSSFSHPPSHGPAVTASSPTLTNASLPCQPSLSFQRCPWECFHCSEPTFLLEEHGGLCRASSSAQHD